MNPQQLAERAERADTLNWIDQHAAAPPAVRQAMGLASCWHGELAMVRSAIPFSHFNMVLTLGCPAPADDAAFAAVDAFFAAGPGGRHWIVVNDHSQPLDLAARLLARGYQADGGWDRVILRDAQPQRWLAHGQDCEIVDVRNVEDWVGFLLASYGMPAPVGDWLRALVGRPGWHHALRREGGQPGTPVAMVRSAYLDGDGWAWLGIDAPVPGVMAPCFADDQQVTAALLRAASQAGARHFVSDIEAVSPDRTGPAYAAWRALGFEPAYLRRLFVKG